MQTLTHLWPVTAQAYLRPHTGSLRSLKYTLNSLAVDQDLDVGLVLVIMHSPQSEILTVCTFALLHQDQL